MKVTAYNLGVAIFAATGGFSYGFGFGVFVSSIGQPGFYEYFNMPRGGEYATNIIGLVNGLFALGAGIGAIAQGYTSDWLGRRKATFAATIFCLVGAALTAGAVNIPMLVAARMLHGIGVGQLVTLSPLYITEVAPPKSRGALLGGFTGAIGLGVSCVTWISFGTYYATDKTVQWRTPLALSVVGPLVQAIGIWFVPESPRWLVWKDRKEDALAVIRRLHQVPGSGSDASSEFAEAEFLQVCQQVAFDKQHEISYWQMFARPQWRRRTVLAMFMLFASQSTGVLGIANYKTLIFAQLGYQGSIPLLLTALYTIIGSFCAWVGAWIADHTGRRKLLLIGFPVVAAILLIEALLQREFIGSGNQSGLLACVAFLFLYIIAYDLTVDPVGFIYVAEIWPTTIRSKGIALAWSAYFIGAITYTAPGALAFRNIGWGYYMLFFGLNIVSTVICYFYVPETKGKTLEEMGELFGDTVILHMTAEGTIDENEKGRPEETVVQPEAPEHVERNKEVAGKTV